MLSFYYFAALMLAAGIWLLARPLTRAPKSSYIENKQVNLDIYKQHVIELQSDLDNNLISQDEFDVAQKDLEKQLINDIPEQESAKPEQKAVSKNDLIMAIFLVPALAIGIYLHLGTPDAIETTSTKNVATKTSPHNGKAPATSAPSVMEMIQKFEQRLAQEPERVEDLKLLSRSYVHTKQFVKAEKIFARLTALVDNDPNLWAEYADIRGVNQKGDLSGKPYQFLQKALALKPDHMKSLWLAGTYYFQQQQFQQAIDTWQKLNALLDPASKTAQTIRNGIAQAQQKLGVPVTQEPAVANIATATTTASISGSVSLDPKLAQQAKPTDTVFVYARAASGPPMPLAVVRKQVKDLPFNFTLDDSMAMMPQMKLSAFDKVVVTARISSSGNAITASGDLISNKNEIASNHVDKLELVIDSVVK